MTRIHLCQIFYNPAYYDSNSDFLEEPAPLFNATTTIGMTREVEAVSSYLIESRAQYVRHITKKLAALASWSGTHKADILVFPEYSVPLEALPALFEIAAREHIIIVAGTHRIRMTESSKSVYEQVGIDSTKMKNGSAISPILFSTGRVEVSTKVSRSKWEPNLDVSSQVQVAYQTDVHGTKVYFAVTPCIDSIQMDIVGQLVGTDPKPNILICPSLSPSTEPFSDMGKLLVSHEIVFAFVNSSSYGGTGYNVPESWIQYLTGPGSHIRSLSSRTEAILEIDVDTETFHLKRGSVANMPPCSKCREYPIIYHSNVPWLESYYQLGRDVIELLQAGDSAGAIEFVDGFLAEQQVSLPHEIVSRLKELRYGQLVLYSGDIASVEKSFDVVDLTNIEDSRIFFAKRLTATIDTISDSIKSNTSPATTSKLIQYLQVLKTVQQDFIIEEIGQETGSKAETATFKDHLDNRSFKPSEASLAMFQDRGPSLERLKEIVNNGSEKVISINGILGIGKTQFLRTFFLKVFSDWETVWIPVATNSSMARVVADIGNSMGVHMDIDSLASCTSGVFRSKVQKLCDALFSMEKYALVVDDIKDIRKTARDYNQLKIFIEVASEPKVFRGSRIFLVSSVQTAPLWFQKAGIARLNLRGLDDMFTKRVIEYNLRSMQMVEGETVPDVPQKLLNIISGHPFSAVVVAQTSGKSGLLHLKDENELDGVVRNIVSTLIPEIELEPEEEEAIHFLSILRTPVENMMLVSLIPAKILDRLVAHAFVDFDGKNYSLHPIFSRYFSKRIPPERRVALHKAASDIYFKKDKECRIAGRREPMVVAELVHHMVLSGQSDELPGLKVFIFEEVYPAARTLYSDRRYDKAFKLFAVLSESHPNDPYVWAYLGRCCGRQQQWSDCDEYFEKAVEVASKTKQNTWWIYRDWGHIYARFKNYDRAKELFSKAKEEGGVKDPSLLASEAYVEWETGDPESARKKFESILGNYEPHGYTLKTYSMLLDKAGESERADEIKEQLAELENEMTIPHQYEIDVEEDTEE